MKLKLGPYVQRALGLTNDEVQSLVDPSQEDDVAAIRMRLMQALAATSLSDLGGRTHLEVKDVKRQQYKLGLKITWDWPVPLALELTVIDESTWEIELIKDDDTNH
ncbi:MAG: hypothetical protein KDK08_18030 [Rhizobiaceae bacterium]|nr:hypothetical protein [Rhizobiaceae bacterium]